MRRLPIAIFCFGLSALVNACGSSDDTTSCDGCTAANPTGSTVVSTTTASPSTQDLPPIAGAGLTFANVTSTSFTVSWSAATDDVTTAARLEYQLVAAPGSSDESIVMAWTANALTFDVTNAEPETTVSYTVVVRDANGNKVSYPEATVTTIAGAGPVIGSALVFSGLTDSGYSVAWGAAVSSVTAAEDLEYRAVVASAPTAVDTPEEAAAMTGAGLLFDWTKNQLALSVTNAAAKTSYTVAVLVRNNRGDLALYPPVEVMTLRHRIVRLSSITMLLTTLHTAAGADANCPPGYKALIGGADRIACTSDNCATSGIAEHTNWVMRPNTSYENLGGELIWTTDAAGIVTTALSHPPGHTLPGSEIYTWSGLAATWRNASDTCLDWTSTSNSDRATLGNLGSSDSTAWSHSTVTCGGAGTKAVLCVEQ